MYAYMYIDIYTHIQGKEQNETYQRHCLNHLLLFLDITTAIIKAKIKIYWQLPDRVQQVQGKLVLHHKQVL